jgi:hypothetical protein
MTVDALDYCLKQLGYRYSVASLKNAIRSSRWIRRQQDGRWTHRRGDAAEAELRRNVPVAPVVPSEAWSGMRDVLAGDIRHLIAQRGEKLRHLGAPYRFGLDWDDETSGVMLVM